MGERRGGLEGLGVTSPRRPDPAFWRAKRVLLTGHTGFKGGWLALWLDALGAELSAFALDPEAGPSLYALADVASACRSDARADLRDAAAVARAVAAAEPEIVIHLGAQALVRRAVAEPLETYATNALGTAHLLEALRAVRSPAAVLIVTTDKVYANDGSGRAFVETDPLGGKDPYAASKAAAEAIAASYAATFFERAGVAVATARGGNVIGGGDFAADRLGPDCVRAAREERPVVLRQPDATRPWQHVLDCLCGYLLFAERLATEPRTAPRALNIGPAPELELPVRDFARDLLDALGAPDRLEERPEPGSVEAPRLALDPTLARNALGWTDALVGRDAILATASWYGAWGAGADMAARTRAEIAAYQAGDFVR